MGQCVSGKKPKYDAIDGFDKQPLDIQQFKNRNLPKLGFQALLANVKIKSCPYSTLSMKFTIIDVQSFGLNKKTIKNDGCAKWKIQHKLGFQMTLYELMKEFLYIQIFDQEQNEVGRIKINLYNLSIGPYHQDFAVNFINNSIGRLSFDLKISQIIQLKLQSTMSVISLNTNHPGQIFNYSIKTIVNAQSLISFPSYSVSIMLDKQDKGQTVEYIQPNSSKKRTKIIAMKQIQFGKDLEWNKQQCMQLPSLVMNILASDLHHACFKILIWKLNEKNMTDRIPNPELYAQCYISFQKLFLNQCDTIIKQGHEIQVRQLDVEQKLWTQGRQVGKGRFKFFTSNQKYLKQMQVCVRTQQGILKSSPVFTNNTEQTSEQLGQLLKISRQIQFSIIQLEKFNQTEKNIISQIRDLHRSIEKDLRKMMPLMQKSSKQSIKFYNYKSKQQLLKAQTVFITIGTQILEYLQSEDQNITELCWMILICLLRRGQFMLNYIGFDEQQKKQILQDAKDKFLKKKIQVALNYQQFIHKLLQLALKSLNVKGLQYERKFAEVFCAYAYFRLPLFRTQILEAICNDDDPEILQWRGIQFNLNEDIDYEQIKSDSNTFTILFDWGNSFHKFLQKQQRYQANYLQLLQILSKIQWKSQLARRKTAFFDFIKYWVVSVQQIGIITKDIQWKYFPGYNRLIRCFLVEMKKRNILQYPDALRITCLKLLANEKLLNIFVSILLNKANMNKPLTVLKALSFIKLLFETLEKRKHKIPPMFNYLFFFKAIKIILESEFSYGISQVLSLIYTHYPLFSVQFKKNISMYILGKVFFKLFLHWSYNVRCAFYHLITFRVYCEALIIHTNNKQLQNYKFKHKMNQQIKERYERLLVILVEAQKLKYQQSKKTLSLIYEKQLYRKMKKKILMKNRKVSENDSVNGISPNKVLSEGQKSKIMALAQGKFFDNQLQKPKWQRSQSQLLTFKPLVETLTSFKPNNKQQVQRYKKSSFRHENELHDLTQTNSRRVLSIQLVDESQFELVPYTSDQIHYIDISMKTFNEINDRFLQRKNQGRTQVPTLIIQIPIDEKEIRPDEIDDW